MTAAVLMLAKDAAFPDNLRRRMLYSEHYCLAVPTDDAAHCQLLFAVPSVQPPRQVRRSLFRDTTAST